MRFRISTRLILTLLLITVLGFGIGTAIVAANPGTFSFNNGSFNLGSLGGKETREATIELGTQDKITIVNSVGELNVELTDGENIEVVYKAYEKSELEIDESTNEIKIKGKISPKNTINGINSSKVPVELNIKLPKSYSDKLEIKNGVGETVLELGSYSDLNVDTGVGEMTITLESLEQGDITAEVGVGSLRFNVPDNSDVELEAKTGVGGIENRASFDSKESDTKFIAQSFKGLNGEGTAKVTLKVGTGDITIR